MSPFGLGWAGLALVLDLHVQEAEFMLSKFGVRLVVFRCVGLLLYVKTMTKNQKERKKERDKRRFVCLFGWFACLLSRDCISQI